ncbi:hypothetical protein [Mesorhizobium sp. M7A.F.Ca.MR.362.00.0.0]|uniref:hypothetical protein n=1 Tax=Mesorhizobium sp. M7A.F.Ca.MR.362.00.0.0 TaxID=2496779 RepID=UPI000FD28B85|nr:hypothetical protein [Mesorhizobium sp. M7A.F.Ca.MR.362.00.0.0]RUU80484.1 hypothetical protein EOC06_12075 [Mesorhizobium sp. M7A.F.Ca.MR.362.00.0.0]
MNAERILMLADVIEGLPHGAVEDRASEAPLESFNMGKWHCGTVGCIAGWAAHVFGGQMVDPAWTGRLVLGLDSDLADDLFTPPYDYGKYDKITPKDAAKVLRNLAETGEVDWSLAAASVQS